MQSLHFEDCADLAVVREVDVIMLVSSQWLLAASMRKELIKTYEEISLLLCIVFNSELVYIVLIVTIYATFSFISSSMVFISYGDCFSLFLQLILRFFVSQSFLFYCSLPLQ